MTKTLPHAVRRDVQWLASHDPEKPYQTTVAGTIWQIRVNDFPAEPLYTLLIDAQAIGDLDNWPPTWRRPAS